MRSKSNPVNIIKPGQGQTSVWDYPRPPSVEAVTEVVRVLWLGRTVAETYGAVRLLETASPPTYYVPPSDVDPSLLVPGDRRTFCEWKGTAQYFDLRLGDQVSPEAAWSYPDPLQPYRALREYLSFYPGRVTACYVGSTRVKPQPGAYYGGWVTPDLVGPFKGEPGTEGW